MKMENGGMENGLGRWRSGWDGRRLAKDGVGDQVESRCCGEEGKRGRQDLSLVTGTLGMATKLASGEGTGFAWLAREEVEEVRKTERMEEKNKWTVESELERRKKIIAIVDEYMLGPAKGVGV